MSYKQQVNVKVDVKLLERFDKVISRFQEVNRVTITKQQCWEKALSDYLDELERKIIFLEEQYLKEKE